MKNKKFAYFLILLIILAGFFNYRIKIKNLFLQMTMPRIPAGATYQEKKAGLEQPGKQAMPAKQQESRSEKIPAEFNLKIPFITQAPSGNWNEDFKEGCEEASLLMVKSYFGNIFLATNEAEKEIMDLINWQKENWQGHLDLTIQTTAELAFNKLGYESKIISNPTVEQIKQLIAGKNPIIMPAAGRILNNPHFKNPGPVYHMLVIKGYTEKGFITNDPGTKFGQDYFYDFATIMNAMHDWDEENIFNGAKRILILMPK